MSLALPDGEPWQKILVAEAGGIRYSMDIETMRLNDNTAGEPVGLSHSGQILTCPRWATGCMWMNQSILPIRLRY